MQARLAYRLLLVGVHVVGHARSQVVPRLAVVLRVRQLLRPNAQPNVSRFRREASVKQIHAVNAGLDTDT
jgi:hypothetical protein